MRSSALEEQLRGFGLSSYEAKSYVSLVSLGPSEPKRVALDAHIPHTSVYPALERLEEKGWIEEVLTKPVTYRAKTPEKVKNMISSKLDELFESLGEIYKVNPTEEAELVYTLRGSDRVLGKIYELIRGARENVLLVGPATGLEDLRILRLIGQAVERGVRVRVISDDDALGLLPPGVELRTGNQIAFDLLVDTKTALIGLPDYSACGWIDSPAVATHFEQFLELLWNVSAR